MVVKGVNVQSLGPFIVLFFEFLKRLLCKSLILMDFHFVFGFQVMQIPTYFSKNNVFVDVEKKVLG